jgi:hypothetical protein
MRNAELTAIADRGLRHSPFGLQAARLRFAPAFYSALRTPHSAFGRPTFDVRRRTWRSRRPAASILEVLFAILVTSVGLLGAVAILPVASSQAKKGRTQDALVAAGRAAVSSFDTRGMRIPGRRSQNSYLATAPPPLVVQPAYAALAYDNWIAFEAELNQFPNINYAPNAQGIPGVPRNRGLARYPWSEFLVYQETGGQRGRNWFNGIDSFCIDPRLIAANYSIPEEVTNNTVTLVPSNWTAARFPAISDSTFPCMWRIGLSDQTRGLTPFPERPMRGVMADAIFMFGDDLVFLRDNDRSKPATLPFDRLTSGTDFGKRQSEGHFSWMATLVPELNGTALGFNDLYTLSLVMFYDRPTSLNVADPQYLLNERFAGVAEINGDATGFGVGFGGGEFLLTASDVTTSAGVITGETRLKLRPNDWICLAAKAPHTIMHGGNFIQVPTFKWYRVSDCEPEATDLGGGNWARYVTLIGQDWPYPATAVVGGNTQPFTFAYIVEGVVGVYEKSVRLEYGEDL